MISLTCRAGFSFAGLEWGGECFCGHSAPPAEDKIAPDHCSLPCPLSPGTCGGSLAIDVFYTGVRIVRRDFEVEQLDGLVGQQVVDQLALLPRLSRYWKIEEVNKYRSVQELRSSSKLFMFF